MEIHELIWFPGVYHGRDTEEYTQNIAPLTLDQVVELVQKRAREDGEYCIANGMVGPNNESEPKMRAMMAFVSDPKNIEQCLDYIYKEGTHEERTVDFVCRDLANASKAVDIHKWARQQS